MAKRVGCMKPNTVLFMLIVRVEGEWRPDIYVCSTAQTAVQILLSFFDDEEDERLDDLTFDELKEKVYATNGAKLVKRLREWDYKKGQADIVLCRRSDGEVMYELCFRSVHG
jgi:hypothetical protein